MPDADQRFMKRAVTLGRQSVFEPRRAGHAVAPRVGAVLVRANEVLAESYRGATGGGDHAEYGLLRDLDGEDLAGTTLYTTLEPCTRRNHPKVPCAQRIIECGLTTVVIGMYDPNPEVYRVGWRKLRDAGIRLFDFTPALRAEVETDNAAFIAQFRSAVGERGEAVFDYTQHGGNFDIVGASGEPFHTRWDQKGKSSIYALDYDNHVALARYAKQFDEIDDPGALDFGDYVTGVSEGEIVVFRNAGGYALVQVLNVEAGPRRGADHTSLRIAYELRVRSDSA
jgi:diaminohydroxyphosphoribosylaminopyrimidine deaminase/5-amino-6-(5-phosphoribosylamino)uracil reductase